MKTLLIVGGVGVAVIVLLSLTRTAQANEQYLAAPVVVRPPEPLDPLKNFFNNVWPF